MKDNQPIMKDNQPILLRRLVARSLRLATRELRRDYWKRREYLSCTTAWKMASGRDYTSEYARW